MRFLALSPRQIELRQLRPEKHGLWHAGESEQVLTE